MDEFGAGGAGGGGDDDGMDLYGGFGGGGGGAAEAAGEEDLYGDISAAAPAEAAAAAEAPAAVAEAAAKLGGTGEAAAGGATPAPVPAAVGAPAPAAPEGPKGMYVGGMAWWTTDAQLKAIAREGAGDKGTPQDARAALCARAIRLPGVCGARSCSTLSPRLTRLGCCRARSSLLCLSRRRGVRGAHL